jgi:hypothetical protein
MVELSQTTDTTGNTLNIKLDRYQPLETDKQYYTWFDDGLEQRYASHAYGISQLDAASSAIDRFLVKNFDGYIESQMRDVDEVTRKTFEVAQQHRVC